MFFRLLTSPSCFASDSIEFHGLPVLPIGHRVLREPLLAAIASYARRCKCKCKRKEEHESNTVCEAVCGLPSNAPWIEMTCAFARWE